MDTELDIMLDILEAGNIRKFTQMVNMSQWSWLIPFLRREQRVNSPLVRESGPLKLAVELSSLLRQVDVDAAKGVDTLVIGKLRRTLEEFHQIPSMENIGLTSYQYIKQVVSIADYVGNNIVDLHRVNIQKLMASYLLSSLDSSWCLIRSAEQFPTKNFTHPLIIGILDIKGDMHHLWVEWGLADDDDITQSAEVAVYYRSAKLHGMIHAREALLWELPEGELIDHRQCSHLIDLQKYLPNESLTSLGDLIKGIGVYIDWHTLKGNDGRMPSQMMPPPPTWLSVWKDVA
jgi:hypothetical protein